MADHAPSPDRLRAIARTLNRLDLAWAGPTVEAMRRRAAITAGEYLAPRSESGSAVIAIAVVGPGGGGKSTIINTLARRRISEAGPIRPTTLEPVVWCGDEVPPTLDGLRTRLRGFLADSMRPPPQGVVLVDTPPPEIADHEGESIAHQVLEVVDAAVFVAGASRYADAEAFDLLEIAASRGIPVIMVLNRLPASPDAQHAITRDFAEKLARRRLIPRSDPELVTTIAETSLASDTGALDDQAVARVAKDIEAMADPQSRPDIVTMAVAGSLRRLRTDLQVLRSEVIDTAVRRVDLLDPPRTFYRREGRRLLSDIRSGRFAEVGRHRLAAALATAAARRAGRAARASAEQWWESAPDLVEGSLFTHGDRTVEVARDRFAFWLEEIADLPARMSGKRWSKRRRTRAADAVLASILDSRRPLEPAAEKLIDRVPGIVEEGTRLLEAEIEGILAADAGRFVVCLGPALPSGVLTDLSEGVA